MYKTIPNEKTRKKRAASASREYVINSKLLFYHDYPELLFNFFGN